MRRGAAPPDRGLDCDSSEAREALIFGYATLPERTIVEGGEILAKAIAQVR